MRFWLSAGSIEWVGEPSLILSPAAAARVLRVCLVSVSLIFSKTKALLLFIVSMVARAVRLLCMVVMRWASLSSRWALISAMASSGERLRVLSVLLPSSLIVRSVAR